MSACLTYFWCLQSAYWHAFLPDLVLTSALCLVRVTHLFCYSVGSLARDLLKANTEQAAEATISDNTVTGKLMLEQGLSL